MSINKVVAVGRLTRDPELRFTPNTGLAVATFTLAVDRPFKDGNGERQTDFISIVVWRKLAENCANYLKKGSQAAVSGRLQTRSFEQDGKRRYVTEVVADEVQFLDSKRGNQESNSLDDFSTEVDGEDIPF